MFTGASAIEALTVSSDVSNEYAELMKVTCDVKNEKITNRSVLKPGDTIGVKGHTCSGFMEYSHLGIYLGNEEVVDYTNESNVRRIHLDVFTETNSRELSRIKYINAPPAKTPIVIMETALCKFKNEDFGTYNIITKNCEHFVTFCTFGKSFSFHVAKTVKKIASFVGM